MTRLKPAAGLVAAGLIAAGQAPAESFLYWIEPCLPEKVACDASDGELAEWALEAWRRASGGSLKFQKTQEREQALLRFYWAGGRDGLYGEARPIRVGKRMGAEIYVRPDLRHLGKEFDAMGQRDRLFRDTIVYLTCLHESGHALGLPHTDAFEDIMYSFQFGGDIREYFLRYRRQLSARGDIRRRSGMSSDDEARVRAVYSPE